MRVSTDAVPGLGPCGVRWLARMLAGRNTAGAASPAVHVYHFTHPTQREYGGIPGIGPGSVLVPHASEIAYVFGSCGGAEPPCQLSPGPEPDLAARVSKYWWSFAVTGDPNSDGATAWPKFDPESDTLLLLDEPSAGGIRVTSHLRRSACDFWEGSGPR